MKKELFYSLEASTRTNHPSPAFQAHKRTRSLAEIRGARQPAPFAAEAPNKTRAPTGRKETPRKEAAAAAHTNSTGTYKGDARALGGQRAATASATARRAKRAAKAATAAPSSPTGADSSLRAPRARASTWAAMAVARRWAAAKRRRGVHTVPLLASSIRRAALFRRSPRRRTHKKAQSLGACLEGQHIGSEILDDTSIHSSEAPPQTLSNGDRNKLSCSSSNDAI